jgi:hypothetical protein
MGRNMYDILVNGLNLNAFEKLFKRNNYKMLI